MRTALGWLTACAWLVSAINALITVGSISAGQTLTVKEQAVYVAIVGILSLIGAGREMAKRGES